MDPYEQQLYKVFDDYDADCSGLLDRKSLIDLCNTLQLEEKGNNLVDSLIKSPDDKVTFSQFRDGLLNVLGAEPSYNTVDNEEESTSREISPKYIYGSKKYGRRSKPNESPNFQHSTQDSMLIDFTPKSSSFKIQRSHSSTEISECRNKNKIKKHLSFSEKNKPSLIKSSEKNEKSFSLEHNRLINVKESIALCQDMCMDKVDDELVEQIFENHTDVDINGRITVGDFFHLLNEKLVTSITNELHKPIENNAKINLVNTSTIVDMWDRAGIEKGQQILKDLGFNRDNVNINDLLRVLDEEIRIAIATSADAATAQDMTAILLQASLSLHRYELACLKQEMEHVFAENSKVKNDLVEANQRAALLAQEVDDNHAKMEASLRSRVQQLELKHAELIKDVRENASHDRDAAAMATAMVKEQQEKINNLQNEENKLKSLINALQEKNDTLEKQICNRDEILRELEDIKNHLTKEVKLLSKENQEFKVLNGKDADEINKLANQIERLQNENQSLRDRNDELTAEVEKLMGSCKSRLSLTKPQCDVDISSEQAECDNPETVWDLMMDLRGGVKRRGDSPSKGHNCLFEDESPRIGKLRKCHRKRGDATGDAKGAYTTSESGFDCDLDSDGSLGVDVAAHQAVTAVMAVDSKVIKNIRNSARIKSNILKILSSLNNVVTAQSDSSNNDCKDCSNLINIISNIQDEMNRLQSDPNSEGSESSMDTIADLKSEITQTELNDDDSPLVRELKNSLEFERQKHSSEKTKLNQTIKDLENSLEQLKIEYDKSEDYWFAKMEIEREAFEEEQKQSDERLSELISKIAMYEEQFTPRGGKAMLPTIDEKCSLEMQFTELEEEFESYKSNKSREVEEKNKEIDLLKEQLRHLEKTRISELKNSPTSPIEYLWNQSTIESPLIKTESKRDYQNPAYLQSQTNSTEALGQSSSDAEKESKINPIKKPVLPKRCNSVEALNSNDVNNGKSLPSNWQQDKKVPIANMIHCSELEGQIRKNAQHNVQERPANWPASNNWSSHMNAEATCAILEQRYRSLQAALLQHQQYADTLQKTARSDINLLRGKLYNAEAAIKDLQQRLTAADLLVKDLYVENCQLTADQRIPKVL